MVLFLSGQEWNDPFVSFSDTGSEYSKRTMSSQQIMMMSSKVSE